MAIGIDRRSIGAEHWTLDTLQRRLACNGQAVELGERAFDLLASLAAAPGRVVDTESLMQQLWPGRSVDENNLHVHVSALRRLLGQDAIRTVRGRGYQLTRALDAADTAAVAANTAWEQGERPGRPPLIGRDTELALLLDLLRQQRSVTVTGTAGVGKTTLALAAVRTLAAGATEVVELAGLADSVPLAEVVARRLGISLPGLQQAQDELLDVLRPRRLLLLLDNCEHRAQEAGRLADGLLRATEGVRLLATSQVALKHHGEQLLRLGALALPAPAATPAEARAAGAVALFCARVAAHAPGFAPEDPARLADVLAICERLDGLPLALELAAARVPLLGLAGVRQRLGQPLKLLAGGALAAPARQQSLRAALEWSHALLSEAEQRALRRLAVFSSSFSLNLAQQLLAEPGDDADWQVLDLLHGLLDKSLLVQQPVVPALAGAEALPRLRLLESTRHFAQQQLLASGESEAMSLRLAGAMLRLFERGEGPRSWDASRPQTQSCLGELEHLREALEFLAGQPAQALPHIELAGASAWIWSRVGLRSEGLRRCRQALDRVDARTPARLEARLQLVWATLAHRRGAAGDIEAATRAADLYRELGDRLGRFRALSILAATHALDGNESQGMAALEELAESFDPGWGLVQWGAYHMIMGFSLAQLDHDADMLALADSSISQVQHLDDDEAIANTWVAMAQMAGVTGDLEAALAHSQRGLDAARRLGAAGRLGVALGDRATYLVELGRVEEALPLAREAVALRAQDGSLGLMLDQLAQLACARGQFREAALALGRAEVHHAWRRGRRERYLRGPHQRATQAVAAALTPAERQEAYARGSAMGDDEVARLTLRSTS